MATNSHTTQLSFDERVKVTMAFLESIGPVRAAQFVVRLSDAIEGLSKNAHDYMDAYREALSRIHEIEQAIVDYKKKFEEEIGVGK